MGPIPKSAPQVSPLTTRHLSQPQISPSIVTPPHTPLIPAPNLTHNCHPSPHSTYPSPKSHPQLSPLPTLHLSQPQISPTIVTPPHTPLIPAPNLTFNCHPSPHSTYPSPKSHP